MVKSSGNSSEREVLLEEGVSWSTTGCSVWSRTIQGGGHLIDLGFVLRLSLHEIVLCLGQVGIRQNGQITLAAMVETTKSQSKKIV